MQLGKYFLILCLFFSLDLNTEETYLQFLPETPIEMTCQLVTHLEHSMKGNHLLSQHQQDFKVILKILNEQPDIPVTQFPIVLSIDFKAFKWMIKANGRIFLYDTADPGTNKTATQIARLINRPFKVTIEKTGLSLYHSPELKLLMAELPVLKEWKFDDVLENFLSPFFCLVGQSLVVNKTYPSCIQDAFNSEISYHIQSIQGDSIKAILVPSHPSSKGEVIWNRQNALFLKYHSKTHFEIEKDKNKTTGSLQISIHPTESL